jgi:vitamin B12/bleomycin/antimicrobial peptide transport system ATP-binding/permease protein
MDAQEIPFTVTAARFIRSVRMFGKSEVGSKAKLLFAAIVALLCSATGLNVANSYVGRNFMTAIADRNEPAFIRQAFLYLGVFAGSTLVAVFARFGEERLSVLWRDWFTRRALGLYLANSVYYRLSAAGELENPDQRITDDIRAFTVTALSFVLMLLNSSFTVVAFSDVLWTISVPLFTVAVLYAAIGSYVTIRFGRPLVRLNSAQLDKEAAFRSVLIHVRENAEAILLSHSEGVQRRRLVSRLSSLVDNFRQITAINRNVGFFSTGYYWLIQIIPALMIAPSFFARKIEFGVVTQSTMVFSTLVAAFSLIVTQYQSLSSFAAVVARLSSLTQAIERSQIADSGVEIVEQNGRLSYERLTLLPSNVGGPLIKDLSLTIPSGGRVLISGSNQAAGLALFRATAGIGVAGSGRIVRPPYEGVGFLPERAYLPPGSLRQLLRSEEDEIDTSDDRILELLRELDIDRVVNDVGGLDVEQDWASRLSLQDQQLLACARILVLSPSFAFLHRVGSSLDTRIMDRVLEALSKRSIGCVVCGDTEFARWYDAVLECKEDGIWTWRARRGA